LVKTKIALAPDERYQAHGHNVEKTRDTQKMNE